MYTLTLATSAVQNIRNQHVWPVKIIAVSASPSLLGSEIFVYQASQERDPFFGDRYQNVASILDMVNLGLTPKFVNGVYQVPFYRSATLLRYCMSAQEATELWEIVNDDVADLVANYNATVDLRTVATATI